MTPIRLFLLFTGGILLSPAISLPASADVDVLEKLFGEWGTETQCARSLLTPRGTKYAAPFNLTPDWLGHGDVWCRMNWSSVHETPDGVDALANALCGEDTVRDYQIRVILKNDQLNLTWNFFHTNGPLMRCDNGSTQ